MTIIESDATVEHEFTPLLAISDHYPKYVVSMDDVWQDNIEGVKKEKNSKDIS